MVTAGLLADLALTPFAEILRRLSAERRTGDLQVRSAKVVKIVFFDHGRVVFAASNLKKDRLGEALVAIGRITDDEFERASALMRGDRKRRLGEALVQAGVLERNEVGRLVSRQVKRIVLSLFELAEGVASFEERACTIPFEYMVSLSVHRLLYVGIRGMASQKLVHTGLGNLDRWVRLAEVPPFRFGVRKCTAEELEVLELAKRRATIRRLAWAPGGLSFPRLRAAYALLAAGVLEDAERPSAPQPIVQMETSTFLLSALQRRPDPTGRAAIKREVEDELARSANLDREKWLRVSRGAQREELIRALEEKMERYHALADAVGDDQGLRTDIELIVGRASSMLRLARVTPRSEVLGPDAAPPGAARPAPVRPRRVPAAPAEVAPSESIPSAPPPARPAKGPAASAAGGAPAPSAAGREGGMTGSAQLEHLLMEASVRMTVSDYANAVRVYAEVVELEPEVAAHRVRLALAMVHYPPMQKQAERQFLEALRLDPDNADLHYQFAIYYKAMKVRSRAVAELRATLHLNPRHKQAREELEALSPRDSALTSLKKLFR